MGKIITDQSLNPQEGILHHKDGVDLMPANIELSYGNLQNYVVDTDPTVTMNLSAYSNYADNPDDEPDETGLRILKYETGTELPLSGARFEVIGPDGDSIGSFVTDSNGEIYIPLLKTSITPSLSGKPPIIT